MDSCGILYNEIGRAYWLGFFLLSAIVSSGAQLGVTSSTGIGASGVVYSMFGFMWAAKERYVSFQRIATKENLILFLGWLLLCIVATWLDIMRRGNTAHITGLLFGTGAAFIILKKKQHQLSAE